MSSLTACTTSGMLLVEVHSRSRFVCPHQRRPRLSDDHTQDLVSGLDGVMFNGLMENIEWFFNLHDKNKDGYLTKDEVLTLSESLLVSLFLMSTRANTDPPCL